MSPCSHLSQAFLEERLSWRAVVQLNIVRSMKLILDAIYDAYVAQTEGTSSPNFPHMTNEHVALRNRLLQVLEAEAVLIRRLLPVANASGAGLREIENSSGSMLQNSSMERLPETGDSAPPATKQDVASVHSSRSGGSGSDKQGGAITPGGGNGVVVTAQKEVSVFAGSAWKSAFNRVLSKVVSSDKMGEDGIDWTDPKDPTRVMNECGSDMLKLWTDPDVRALLRAQKLRLEEMPGL